MPGYDAVNAYDAFGRPDSTTETIDGNAYAVSTTYDAFNRIKDIVYPSGLTARNVYTADGHLEAVTNAASGTEYWKALLMDARGNVTKFRLGNGVESTRSFDPFTGFLDAVYSTDSAGTVILQDLDYTFDALGNLTQREDVAQSLVETFVYDSLNRVTQIDTITGSGTAIVTVSYDALGNITNKSDVGAYTYGQAHAGCSSGHAGPHAVTTVAGTKNATYCYDSNGNMTSGDGRTVSYSAFDKPVSMAKDGASAAISYGPDRARYKRVDTTSGGTITTTTYVAGRVYEVVASGATIENKHYIGGFAVVTTNGVGGEDTAYLLGDHLGSVDVITDAAGLLVERLSFDAWGKRREAGWTGMVDPLAYTPLVTPRGFTGHEHLDAVGLVHMNGRVYDPELGRFLSADPVVQDRTNLQSLNRYSYVLNNPLSLTDPSGFFFGALFGFIGDLFNAVFEGIQAVLKTVLGPFLDIPILGTILQAVGTFFACAPPTGNPGLCAAVAAGFSTARGGSLLDALTAAGFAYAGAELFAELKDAHDLIQIGASGLFGGTTNELSGGSFVEGFVAGAVGAGARLLGASQFKGDSGGAIAGRVALASLAGGATAKVLGGKFENGAITGAFVALFYEWQSGSFDKPKPSAQFLRQEADSMNVGINVSVPDVVIKVVNFIESTNVAGDPILPVSSVEGGIIFGFPGPGDPEASFGAKFYGEVGIGADATLPVDGRGNFRAGAAIVGEYSPLNIDETVGDSISGSVQFGPGGITGSLRPDGSFGSAGVVFGPGVGASVQGTTRCVASFADGINC